MWRVIRNHVSFVVPLSVVGQQTYAVQSEEKAEINRVAVTRVFPPFRAFSCRYYGFWLVSFFFLFFVPIGPYDFFRSRFQRIYWRKRLMWKLKLLFQFILSVNTKNTWPLSFCKNRKILWMNTYKCCLQLLSGCYEKGTCLDFCLLP